jgi:protein-S-isoprenylcysteine O-methyltransferase Ste14
MSGHSQLAVVRETCKRLDSPQAPPDSWMPKPAFFLLSSEAKVAFATLLALYWLSESLIALRMRAGHKDRTDDRGSLRLIAIVFPVSWWIGVPIIWLVPQASIGGSAVFGAGLILMIAGQLLRWWSVATLGRLFTVNVAIREGHQLIDSGPYHFVRHPRIRLFCSFISAPHCASATS